MWRGLSRFSEDCCGWWSCCGGRDPFCWDFSRCLAWKLRLFPPKALLARYGSMTTLVATRFRVPLTLNNGPRTETTPETKTCEKGTALLFSEKIVGAEVW